MLLPSCRIRVERFSSPEGFLDRAGPFLDRAEVENELIRGLATSLASKAERGEGIYLAVVAHDGKEVAACALRTPPWKLIITQRNDPALHCLAQDLVEAYGVLPAVLGPETAVSRFAEHWSKLARTQLRPGLEQRVFEARGVTHPERPSPGVLRAAQEDDFPLVLSWTEAFIRQSGLEYHHDQEEATRGRIANGRVFLWQDEGPVSMSGWAARTDRGVRVNLVYTPPEHRRRGYATACVARLTQRLLAARGKSPSCSRCMSELDSR